MNSSQTMNMASWTIIANEFPISRDPSKGLARPIYTFPYTYNFVDSSMADPNLIAKLVAEKTGIFRLWVDGLCWFVARGSKFDVPVECEQMKASWLAS